MASFDLSAANKLARFLSPSRWEDIVQDAFIIWAECKREQKYTTCTCVNLAARRVKCYSASRAKKEGEELTRHNEPRLPLEEGDEDVNAFVEQLNGKARIVANCLLEGKSKSEIASLLNVSKPRVSALIADMREKLERV